MKFWKQFVRQVFFIITLVIGCLWAISCKDDYPYDDKEPTWLGASIYDYLKADGHYSYYVRLIEETGYQPVLSKTGSKTLFVANDSAFQKFFEDNAWGVRSYEELSSAQKYLIMRYGMIDNAYLIETLSNYNTGSNSEGSLIIGQAIRHNTSTNVLDTIPFEKGDQLPDGAFWTYYKTAGIHLLKDETSWPIVYFFQKMMDMKGMSNDDFKVITGFERQANDAYIFDKKVIKRDITCKNGYVHVLNGILLPPKNMADYIQNEPSLSLFSSIMDRYCAPYYNDYLTKEYRKTHPEFTDSIFVKKFYSNLNGYIDNPLTSKAISLYPDGTSIDAALLLPYDPGWNGYHYYVRSLVNVAPQSDMAVMLVPTNEAMETYFNTGKGALLKERFGTWSSVPDDIIVMLLKRHMRTSFFASLPSQFPQMFDSDNVPYNITKEDIDHTYIGMNGLVYVTRKVFSPIDYESVYGPILFGKNTRIFEWVIRENRYRFYLNSAESRYSILVPTDEYLNRYIDPFTISKTMTGALKFYLDTVAHNVSATVYQYDKATNTVGDSVATILNDAKTGGVNNAFITDRLIEILDNHIIVGDIESGQKVYLTRGNNVVRVTGSGIGMTLEGGGDIVLGQKSTVKQVYNQINGKTFFLDKPIQTPLRSVYSVLSTTPEFSEFFALLSGFPSDSKSLIFKKDKGYYCSDYVVRFFNTFHYTVYVPTNDAINDAITKGVITPWVSRPGITGINDITDATQRNTAIVKLERFLRYHFQDNEISLSGDVVDKICQTATGKLDDKVTHFGTYKNRYYKLGLTGNGNNLTLTTEVNGTANVVTQNNLYNIYTRENIFSGDPATYRDLTGNPPDAIDYAKSSLTTSSSAVIHQIDKVLLFE